MKPFKITERVSHDDSDSTKIYHRDIRRQELISPEEEARLAERIHAGDEEALNTLVSANLRFVVTVAKQYQNLGLPLPDLISYGNMGLMEAAQRFDETRGFRFLSYAVWWIRESILKGLAENGRNIRLPKGQVDLIGRINKTISAFEQENGRTPSESEIADILGIVDKSVVNAINASARTVSIDAPRSEDDDRDYLETVDVADSVSADDETIKHSRRKGVKEILSVLPPYEQYILFHSEGLCGYEKMSIEEIAQKLGKTELRIRQVRDKAMRHLKKEVPEEVLRKLY